jgi:hypothetical protein
VVEDATHGERSVWAFIQPLLPRGVKSLCAGIVWRCGADARHEARYTPDGRVTMCDMEAQDHPFPHYKNIFKVKRKLPDGNYEFQCIMCPAGSEPKKCHKSSAANLKKHLKAKHPNAAHKLAEQGRGAMDASSTTSCGTSGTNQATLDGLGARIGTTQRQVNSLVVSTVIDGLQPFSVVEQQWFQRIFKELAPGKTVMTRPTLANKLDEEMEAMRNRITKELDSVEHVCCTADAWKASKNSYLGMTVHFIDSSDMSYKNYGLALRRLRGPHTYDVLAKEMNSVLAEFRILNKTVCILTDNGANFVKALREFQLQLPLDNEDEDNPDDLVAQSIAEALKDDVSVGEHVFLPPHQRCAAHTLSLVATKGAEKAMKDTRYKKISRSAVSKLSSIWNKQNQSSNASDAVQEVIGRFLLTPCATRWNSMYDSMVCVQKNMEKMDEISDRLGVPRLTTDEKSFIKEYCSVMSSVAGGLDILQGDSVSRAHLLPTLNVISDTLKGQQNLRYCSSLASALLESLETRFREQMGSVVNKVATAVHPFFKLSLATTLGECATVKSHVKDRLNHADKSDAGDNPSADVVPDSTAATSTCQAFFARFNVSRVGSPTTDQELESFLANAGTELGVLGAYPTVKKVFLELNTAIPSSAPAERLFSIAKNVFGLRRGRLSDKNFETQCLLHVNRAKK